MTRALVEILRREMRGPVVAPGDAGYDEARAVWNARIDRRPAAVARCQGARDVQTAIGLARAHGVPLAVRGGGHDYAGHSVCDDGLVIDLSRLDQVQVEPQTRTAWAGAGVRWRALDHAAQQAALATPGGTVSTVGVSGFTLGGGQGYLTRKYGLACDNLLAADVVLASGDLVRASASERPDLFWGLRGGSGNLGIVTAFQFQLHPVGPQVVAGQILHPFERAGAALRAYRDFMLEAPDDVQGFAFFIRIPALPAFPAALHGRVVLDLVVAALGDPGDGELALAPLRQHGTPVIDTVARLPYEVLQQAFDAGMAPGNRWYTKAHELRGLPDAAIDTILQHTADLPGALTMAYLGAGGGAMARIPPEATAYPHRDSPFGLHVLAGWTDAADDERMMAWARAFHQDMTPHATGGTYVNLLDGDEADVPAAAWGANRRRLAELKRRYDPDHLFRSTHVVAP